MLPLSWLSAVSLGEADCWLCTSVALPRDKIILPLAHFPTHRGLVRFAQRLRASLPRAGLRRDTRRSAASPSETRGLSLPLSPSLPG